MVSLFVIKLFAELADFKGDLEPVIVRFEGFIGVIEDGPAHCIFGFVGFAFDELQDDIDHGAFAAVIADVVIAVAKRAGFDAVGIAVVMRRDDSIDRFEDRWGIKCPVQIRGVFNNNMRHVASFPYASVSSTGSRRVSQLFKKYRQGFNDWPTFAYWGELSIGIKEEFYCIMAMLALGSRYEVNGP